MFPKRRLECFVNVESACFDSSQKNQPTNRSLLGLKVFVAVQRSPRVLVASLSRTFGKLSFGTKIARSSRCLIPHVRCD